MDAGTRRLFVAAIVLIVAITGSAALLLSGPTGTPGPTDPGQTPNPTVAVTGSPVAGASSSDPQAIPASPVRGVVVAVDSRGLDDVRAFTLRADDGAILVFDLREMRDTPTFPLGHLAEHQATAQPVLVTFRAQDGVLIATQVADA
jgi:hypothetical protein